jgi:hypothetical protein
MPSSFGNQSLKGGQDLRSVFECPASSEFCLDAKERSFLPVRHVNESTKRIERFAVFEQWEKRFGFQLRLQDRDRRWRWSFAISANYSDEHR